MEKINRMATTSTPVGPNSGADANPMLALLDSDYGLSMPSRGEIREGVVARVTPSEILVDVGAKSEGVIAGRELDSLDEATRKGLQMGQTLLVYVLDPEDRNGNIVLSLTRAREEQDWRDAETLLGNQEVYSGSVAGFNKGGLIVKLGNVRGFVPASQLGPSRRRRSEGDTPEQKWARMVGEAMQVKVIEVDRGRNRLILSERAAAKESREAQKDKLLAEIKTGDVRTGHVISLADFGAFVDIGGADGLVHLSELSWKHVTHPNEVLRVGQEVEVVVLNVDHDRKRIGLSLKRREDDPWTVIQKKYQIGQLVKGTITKLAKFGAFARVEGEDEIEGLIHVSELSEGHIEHPREVVAEGQALTLRVLKIEADKRRMGLSLKRVSSADYENVDWETVAAATPDLDEVA
ncbi:MAG: S1 RNA-binding domain-containing protein [Anaerolineales bacterium]|nr:S1 RNA-binding domain-containing protein [Anaerolineales bacterium]